MAEKSAPSSFGFSSMDWNSYIQFRPAYPEELYSTVYAYHDSHKGAYDSALDIGAGVGIVSAELVKKFSHVTVTDPSESYVASAKTLFGDAGCPPEKVSFLQTKAEELSLEKLPKGEKVDLVTAAECLHWADVDAAMPRIASVLKSGGTFAGWLYGVRVIFSEEDADLAEARQLYHEIYDKLCRQIEKQTGTAVGARTNARLDDVPFAADTWMDVRRIHTNTEAVMCSAIWTTTTSKVSEGERVEKFENEKLLYHDADYEYLEGYLLNLYPIVKVTEFAKEELVKLKKAMDGKKIGVTWPFVLVLATRK